MICADLVTLAGLIIGLALLIAPPAAVGLAWAAYVLIGRRCLGARRKRARRPPEPRQDHF